MYNKYIQLKHEINNNSVTIPTTIILISNNKNIA